MPQNITRLYLLSGLQSMVIGMPIAVLFWQDNGLSLQQIFILQAVFSIVLIALEIPTGHLADRWGRKNSLLLGSLFITMGYSIYAVGASFRAFLAAEIVIACAFSLNSGALEALMYDSLLEHGAQHTSRRVFGKQFMIMLMAEAGAGIAGGLLALTSLRLAMAATVPCMALSIGAALSLREPQRMHMPCTKHLTHIRHAVSHALHRDVRLRSVIALYGVLGTLTLFLAWFTQPYQQLANLPIAFFGVTHAIALLGAACAAHTMMRLEKRMDDRLLLIVLTAIIISTFMVLSAIHPAIGIFVLLAGRSAFGALKPLVNDILNKLTASNMRATVLSINSCTFRIVFASAAPIIGTIADVTSIQRSLLILGTVGGLLALIVFILMRRVWDKLPQ